MTVMKLSQNFNDCPRPWQNLIDFIHNGPSGDRGFIDVADLANHILTEFDAELVNVDSLDTPSVQFNTESGYLLFILKYS
jgi:hypothetical protein